MDSELVTHQIVYLLGKKRLGRRTLARLTGNSEMRVRLQLERLRDQGLVKLDRQGATLTRQGKSQFATVLNAVKDVEELPLASLSQDTVTLAALIADSPEQPAWYYRDFAIRAGASGLLMLQVQADGVIFSHNKEPISRHNRKDARIMDQAFPNRGKGDIILVVSAPDRARAGRGLWWAIMAILTPSIKG
jgi:predicted transcriptional regulator